MLYAEKKNNSVVSYFSLLETKPIALIGYHQARKTYKSATDDDTESIVLGVTDDVIAGHECCPLVKVPHHHVFLFELKIVHHVLAI